MQKNYMVQPPGKKSKKSFYLINDSNSTQYNGKYFG